MSNIGYATLTVIPSARGMQSRLNNEIGPQMEAAGRHGGGLLSKGLKAAAIVGIAGVLAGIGAVVHTGIGEVMDASAANAQLRAGIKSTGNAANVTLKGMNNLASSIQSYSGQTDDSIAASQKLLLTFTNIQNRGPNKIFDMATKATADMAAKMGGDASGSAIQLGKALNDPIKGVGALSRVGVSFTEGQKKTIAQMVKNGNVMGAQKVILKELNKEFGGAAKAAGDSLPGKLQRAKRAFEDISQTVVSALIPIVMPALQGIASFITGTVIPAVEGFVKGFKKGTGAGGQFHDILARVGAALQSVGKFLLDNKVIVLGVAAAIASIVAGLKIYNATMAVIRIATAAWTVVQLALNASFWSNPIFLIVVAVAALVAAIVAAYFKFDTFRNIVDATWQGIQVAVAAVVGFFQERVMPVLRVVFAAISVYVQTMFKIYQTVWNAIWWVVEKVVAFFQTYVMPVVRVVWAAISTSVQTLLTVYRTVWNAIWGIVEKVVNWFKTTALPIIRGVVDNIREKWEVLRAAAMVAWERIQAAVRTVVVWFVNNVLPKIQGFVNGVREKFEAVTTFIGGIAGRIKAFFVNAGVWLINAGKQIVEGLKAGFSAAWESVKGFITDKIGGLVGGVQSLLGIQSPSRVFMTIGGNVVEGFEIGLRGLDKLKDKIRQPLQALLDVTNERLGKLVENTKARFDAAKQLYDDFRKSVFDSITGNVNITDAWQATGDQASAIADARKALADAQLAASGPDASASEQQSVVAAQASLDAAMAAARNFEGNVGSQIDQSQLFGTAFAKASQALAAQFGINSPVWLMMRDQMLAAGPVQGAAMASYIADNGFSPAMAEKLSSWNAWANTVATEQAKFNYGAGREMAKNAMLGLKDKVADAMDRIMRVGGNISEGVIAGFRGGRSAWGDAIDEYIGEARARLGIRSPSREFMEIGEYSGLGYVKGWQRVDADEAMRGLMQGAQANIGTLDFATSADRAAAVDAAANAPTADQIERLIAATEANTQMVRDQAERDRQYARKAGR